MFEDILIKSIKRGETLKEIKEAQKKATLLKKIYTGEGQDEILLDYRKRESVGQKEDRKRITITRTKHIVKQTENVFNQLDFMDKPAIKVISKNERVSESLNQYIYDNNLDSYAFNLTRYYNLIDSNTFIVCREGEFQDVEFKVVTSSQLYDVYYSNAVLKGVVFRFERESEKIKVFDYELYTNDGVYIFEDRKGKDATDKELKDGFIVTRIQTGKMFAFPLGYIVDDDNSGKIFCSILEPATELFKNLIWQGSELDTDLAKHGIIKQFQYQQKCNYRSQNKEVTHICNNGYLLENNIPTSHKCPHCDGSGLKYHKSSQEIISLPYPDDPTNAPKLADLSHTIFAPNHTFEFKKNIIKEIEQDIIKTIFNSSIITQSDVATAATATEKVIELQGVYAALNQLGKKVSDLFIWMVECVGYYRGFNDFEVLHGYTLNLKLESIETLVEKRKKMLDASAPNETIKAIDMAIMMKQHMDSPQYINNLAVWEQYRPFSDKSENIIQQILSNYPNTNYYKILYIFWSDIKNNIEKEYGEMFFDMEDQKRKEIIKTEVEKIRAVISESETPQVDLDFE
jgi:hypothetical protein